MPVPNFLQAEHRHDFPHDSVQHKPAYLPRITMCCLLEFQSELLNLFLRTYLLHHSSDASEFLIECFVSTLDVVDVIYDSNTVCCQSCDHQCRTCTKIRCADSCTCVTLSTPLIIAILPSTLMLAPILCKFIYIFEAILKNTLSDRYLFPRQVPAQHRICGCISVGNPGYGKCRHLRMM